MAADRSGNVSSSGRRSASTSRIARERIYVKVGMAGVSGVISPEQLRPGCQEYEDARHALAQDLRAVIEGALRGGASEALVYDAHLHGRNINLDVLDERVRVIAGRPEPRDGFFYGLDESFVALYLVGYRARAQAPGALLPGTYDDEIASLRVNETEVGEIGMEAALAGKFGIPLAFVSGDSATVRETHELLGDEVEAVEVKEALGPTSAICLPTAKTTKLLRAAAARAFQKARRLPAVVFRSPTTLHVEFRKPESAKALARTASARRVGECGVCIEGQGVVDVFRTFVQARSLNRAPAAHSSRSSASASA